MIGGVLLALTVATPSAQAQASFERGLTFLYAYDRAGATAAFAGALHGDPHLAIAAWGEALAAASDLNHPLTPDRFVAAQSASLHAVALEPFATPQQRAYIDAVALRYKGSWEARSADEARYLAAMDRLVAQWPLDDDAAVIEAEALLEDRAASNAYGQKALALVQTVLRRDPGQLMANHLCIHIYDGLADRTPAIACADRLNALQFAPNEEHLAHMPAHTYSEVGSYAKAVNASDRAWQLREVWNNDAPPYSLEYAIHDAEVGYGAAMMLENESAAQLWGDRFGQTIGNSLELTTLARFGEWSQIIRLSSQPDPHKAFALGLAYAHIGDLKSADAQLALLRNNFDESDFANMLQAVVEERRGHLDAAAAALRRAADLQKLMYTGEELPLFPAEPALGALYDRAGHYTEARDVLEKAVTLHPDDPRALYALLYACAQIGDGPCSTAASQEFHAVWHGPPPNLTDL